MNLLNPVLLIELFFNIGVKNVTFFSGFLGGRNKSSLKIIFFFLDNNNKNYFFFLFIFFFLTNG